MQKRGLFAPLVAVSILATTPTTGETAENKVRIFVDGDQRCIQSNGAPNHSIGQFPNSGNPHHFAEQDQRFCFDLRPERRSSPTRGTPNVGIALNVIVDPD